jgi:transcriptional regulator with XRE-family HTH domain
MFAKRTAEPAIVPPMRKTHGALIREARETAGLSLRALAKALDVSPGYLSKVENDQTALTTVNAVSAARACGTDPLPIVEALILDRGEARLHVNGDTKQRRELTARLELMWAERALTPRKVEQILAILRGEQP